MRAIRMQQRQMAKENIAPCRTRGLCLNADTSLHRRLTPRQTRVLDWHWQKKLAKPVGRNNSDYDVGSVYCLSGSSGAEKDRRLLWSGNKARLKCATLRPVAPYDLNIECQWAQEPERIQIGIGACQSYVAFRRLVAPYSKQGNWVPENSLTS